jgi:hypothetical protein
VDFLSVCFDACGFLANLWLSTRELVLQLANQMASNLDHSLPDDECPFVFFTDVRFSSAKTMVELQGMGFSSVMSCSSKMAPQVLMTWMKQNLEKREWKTVYNSKHQATLTTIRVKKNTYLHLLTDWARTPPSKLSAKRRPHQKPSTLSWHQKCNQYTTSTKVPKIFGTN